MTARLWYAYAAAIGAAAAVVLVGTVWAVVTLAALPSPQVGWAELATILLGAIYTIALARTAVVFYRRGKKIDGGAE